MASKGLSHIKRGEGWSGVGFIADEDVAEQENKGREKGNNTKFDYVFYKSFTSNGLL
jgi:hypothetical protein